MRTGCRSRVEEGPKTIITILLLARASANAWASGSTSAGPWSARFGGVVPELDAMVSIYRVVGARLPATTTTASAPVTSSR
jgi:hypothetical protein